MQHTRTAPRRWSEPSPGSAFPWPFQRADISGGETARRPRRLVARPNLRRSQLLESRCLPELFGRARNTMTTRQDILTFLRDPCAFARSAIDPSLWTEGLNGFA